jgi:hypothetical protein
MWFELDGVSAGQCRLGVVVYEPESGRALDVSEAAELNLTTGGLLILGDVSVP